MTTRRETGQQAPLSLDFGRHGGAHRTQAEAGAIAGIPAATSGSLALVHDYLTQRGGAERVVLALTRAFPGAPLYTSLYHPEGTFPEFAQVDVRALSLNRSARLRRSHRIAFPLLAPAFSRLHIDADVAIASSSGWAHGARVRGRKIVYCHAPARWLYQEERYLGERPSRLAAAALDLGRRPLLGWDRRAAASADRYLANSTATRDRIRSAYGITAEVVPPPHSVDTVAPLDPDPALEPGFLLCVSRLLPYKNVDAIVEAFAGLGDLRLVVVGAGPDAERLRAAAPANVTFAGTVSDERLRWLYASALGTVAASFEDFGLTPLEAAAFGRPTAALRFGGFLDTIVEGETGLLFDQPEPRPIAAAVRALAEHSWNAAAIAAHAATFSEARFTARLQEIVREVAA